MPSWIVYGLVIVFFLVLPLIIFFFVEEPASAISLYPSSQNGAPSKATKVLSYSVLVALFALIFVLTVFSQKPHKAASS